LSGASRQHDDECSENGHCYGPSWHWLTSRSLRDGRSRLRRGPSCGRYLIAISLRRLNACLSKVVTLAPIKSHVLLHSLLKEIHVCAGRGASIAAESQTDSRSAHKEKRGAAMGGAQSKSSGGAAGYLGSCEYFTFAASKSASE
jgi:hypothetical protein